MKRNALYSSGHKSLSTVVGLGEGMTHVPADRGYSDVVDDPVRLVGDPEVEPKVRL
jgi:hypothetical protein